MLGFRRGKAFRHVAPPHHRGTGGRPEGRSRTADRPPAQPRQNWGAGADAVWEPPVFLTVATQNQGGEDVVDAMERHAGFLAATGELARRRRERLERLTREGGDRPLRQLVWGGGRGGGH